VSARVDTSLGGSRAVNETLLSRRQVLRTGALGGLSLVAPGAVTAAVSTDRPLGAGAADRSVIIVWLCGGPSHLDTWDLKPDAPDGIRGPYKPAATAVPGLRISELHTRLAPLA